MRTGLDPNGSDAGSSRRLRLGCETASLFVDCAQCVKECSISVRIEMRASDGYAAARAAPVLRHAMLKRRIVDLSAN
jgi:hypothetical protein